MISKNIICLIVICILFSIGHSGIAQVANDTRYYETYPDHIIGRLYLSRKYTAVKIRDNVENQDYLFSPNTTLNHGVGATYKFATLNLAYGFDILNPDRGQGETKYLDLQVHAYPKNFILDMFGQFYSGYHLSPQGFAAPPSENFYVSPDMVVTKIGAFGQYLFNGDKLSLRASFLQNEWQKRSAGSFLVGFEMYGGRVMSDSTLLPVNVVEDPARNFRTLRFFNFGPNAGYAYTLVIKKHWFVTTSATMNLNFGYSMLEGQLDRNTEWGIRPNMFLRAFAGYNSDKWSINANYVYNEVRFANNQQFSNSIMTGNYRLNFIYRFQPGPQSKRYLKVIDDIAD
ncbi:DUF4421 domain-containing protein [Anditalea andensis]|uniref:Signal protein n=1 Tax=Anditalea andensis TaxID=1048983 RepID=A0A074KS91_9BACT|nr:DUF4421 domain-containing protein [Anditalea andensis]KEO72826.1 signal protein [Anditalea andensis]